MVFQSAFCATFFPTQETQAAYRAHYYYGTIYGNTEQALPDHVRKVHSF